MEPPVGTGAVALNSSISPSTSTPTLSEHSWTCIDLVSSFPSSNQPQIRSLGSIQDNPKLEQGTPVQTPNSHQQPNKHLQQERQCTVPQPVHAKSTPTYLDEFQNGFPVDGLSSVSMRWWGNTGSDDPEAVSEDRVKNEPSKDSTAKTEETNHQDDQASKPVAVSCVPSPCITENYEVRSGSAGVSLLSAIRKRNAEDGSEMLRFGITRGYGASRLSKRQKSVLSQVF